MTKVSEAAAMFGGGAKKGPESSSFSSAASKFGGAKLKKTSGASNASPAKTPSSATSTPGAPKWKKPENKAAATTSTPSPSQKSTTPSYVPTSTSPAKSFVPKTSPSKTKTTPSFVPTSASNNPSASSPYKKPSQMKLKQVAPNNHASTETTNETTPDKSKAFPTKKTTPVQSFVPTGGAGSKFQTPVKSTSVTPSAADKKTKPASATKVQSFLPPSNTTSTPEVKPKLKHVERSNQTTTPPATAPAYSRGGLKHVTPKAATPNTATPQSSSFPQTPKLKHVKTKVIGEAPTNNQGGSAAVSSSSSSSSSPPKVIPRPPAEKDWDHLYELAQRYDLYKQHEAKEKKQQAAAAPQANEPEPPRVEVNKTNIKARLEGIMGDNYTAKADWLDKAFIDKYLEPISKSSYSFHFTDPKLFKRFDKTDEANRDKVILQFVETLLKHEKQGQIIEINMSNCLVPDEFVQVLVQHILKNPPKYLPHLQVLNLESNALNTIGFQAVADLVAQHRFLQVLKLENQKDALSSAAEEAIAHAVAASPTIVVCSLRLRGGIERTMMNNQVTANIDSLRQARRQKAQQSGTLKERKRNEMEVYFDSIAANQAGADGKPITTIDLVANNKFMALSSQEQVKAAAALATNTTVTSVKMVKLKLGDDFAKELGNSLKGNTTIQKLLLDSNAFSGVGIQAILQGLASNPHAQMEEVQLRHQTKTMASSDEEGVPELVESCNMTLTKCGLDLRNPLVKMKVDRQMDSNREAQRKARRNGGSAPASTPQKVETIQPELLEI